MPLAEREALMERIAFVLESEQYVAFAYVFGSFLSHETFNDIDVAVYLTDSDLSADEIFISGSRLDLHVKLERVVDSFPGMGNRIPLDVRVLNRAPLSFAYNVLRRGRVVHEKDSHLRSDFEGRTYADYFDYQHIRNAYLKSVSNAAV